MKEDDLSYRVAASGDEAGILEVFAEVAPEVPTAVRDGTEDLIGRLVSSGLSLVAVDAYEKIVGYALAEPYDKETLALFYVDASKAARDQHFCSGLISKLKKAARRR